MNADPTTLPPMRLETLQVERIWGGQRLGDGDKVIGESWGAYERNRFVGGPLDGMTLEEACKQHGAALLGPETIARHGNRFPILTKLLDTSEWLSVQLHPNDEQAQALEGEGQVGKTEAWHLLATEPEAEIILGLRPGVDRAAFAEAIRSGATLNVIARQPAAANDTWFIPAGTVHALGPGIFLYEIQQASDITYRVYDWDRPASANRELHLDQAIQCVDPAPGEFRHALEHGAGRVVQLVECPYFTLGRLALGATQRAALDTRAATFHALTAVQGAGQIRHGEQVTELDAYATVLVPASAGRYEVEAEEDLVLMVASA